MTKDVLTKNLASAEFDNHNSSFVNDDIYWCQEGRVFGTENS